MCGFDTMFPFPAPALPETSVMLGLFLMNANTTASWDRVRHKIANRNTWFGAAAQASLERFIDAELDYTTEGRRGLGRASTYIPRLGAWKRADIASLPPDQRARLRKYITQIIGAGYGSYLSYRLIERDITALSFDELYQVWVPRIYASWDAGLPDDVRRALDNVGSSHASIFKYQYENVLRLKIGLFNKVKFGTIALSYFGVGACLADTEQSLIANREALTAKANT